MKYALLASTFLVTACGGIGMPTVRPHAMPESLTLNSFDIAYETGKRHLLANHVGLAVVSFERALAIDPSSVAALNAIGAAYDDLHRPDAATRYYALALALEPDSADTLNNMAVSAAMMGDKGTAADLFARAASLDAKNPLIHQNMQIAGLVPADRPPNKMVPIPDLVAAVSRQESRGDATAVSPKNAQGLMQVLPGTGEEIARQLGLLWRPDLMTLNTPEGRAYNMKIGTTYLTGRLAKYGNQTLALAAYNAGDTRVDDWIAKYGDPRTGIISEEAWIAKLPFKETRQYVQSINAVIHYDWTTAAMPTVERTGLSEYTLTLPSSPVS
jgi:soluble lytic murein transglycosylase-like protein